MGFQEFFADLIVNFYVIIDANLNFNAENENNSEKYVHKWKT